MTNDWNDTPVVAVAVPVASTPLDVVHGPQRTTAAEPLAPTTPMYKRALSAEVRFETLIV
ncbi:MAG: hypothetical protein HW416_3717 [Chloroflexi bacterium]|nr:hypothetical protein [Chloroflexota bacterium]